jgi:hypothetical protein
VQNPRPVAELLVDGQRLAERNASGSRVCRSVLAASGDDVGVPVTAEAVDVAELAPHVRVTGKPAPHEVQAFARLVRRGQVPTAGAVRGEMASRSAGAARRRQLEKTRAATVEDLTGTGPAAAAYVRGYRERTGHGPSWGELRRQAGWPREVTDNLMPRLRAAGWLAYDDEPGSLRPGPAAAPRPAEVG